MPFLDWVSKAQAVSSAADMPHHLLALKALLPFYRGWVKCIYIDPPYNTQSAFEHYDHPAVLAHLEEQFPHDGSRVIYGETTRFEVRLRESGIIFKQIPYDIKAR